MGSDFASAKNGTLKFREKKFGREGKGLDGNSGRSRIIKGGTGRRRAEGGGKRAGGIYHSSKGGVGKCEGIGSGGLQ